MKTSAKIAAAGAAVLVIAGAVALSRPEYRQMPGTWPLQKSAARPGAPAKAPPAPANLAPQGDEAFDTEEDSPSVRVPAGERLGEVNGAVLTLKDLVPLPADKPPAEQTLPQSRLKFLYDRAIDRELVFQAAQKEGVKLTPAQVQALEEAKARRQVAAAGAFDTLQEFPEEAAFEQRDYTALLLQAALAEKHGVPSPHVTPSHVQAYYEEHKAQFGPLPDDPARRQSAWQKIDRDIRLTLAPILQEEHDARFDLFWKELKGQAKIVHSPIMTQAASGDVR